MKMGGLTWWRNNYGSILQAYALQQKLNSYSGVEYEIINQYGKKTASIDNLINKLKNVGIKKTFKRAFWKFGFKKVRNRSKNIQEFVDHHLRVSTKTYNEDTILQANNCYDGFICGSDQVWNPAITDIDSMYWLGFANTTKLKIAYAPSIGVDSFSEEEIKCIKHNLGRFRAISCREKSGADLLTKITGIDVKDVLDPTLMVNPDVWDKLYKPAITEKKYLFAYMLRGNKSQRKIIEKYAKLSNLLIINIPFLEAEHICLYDAKFGNIKVWDSGPDDFISLIKNAECVFTDSFHSTVFCCLNHKKFFIFPKTGKAQMNRLIDLQLQLGITSRIVTSMEDVLRVEKEFIDWKAVEDRISVLRAQSQNYLDSILGDFK